MFIIISQENACVGVSFLIKLQAEDQRLYEKETSVQIFSCVSLKTPDVNCLIIFDAVGGGGVAKLNSW